MEREGFPLAAPSISLSDLEARLFALLLAASQRVAGQPPPVLRVAGGWVRDKLLGRESDDIDIALDNTSGVAFAHLVNDYLKEQGLETHSVGVIQANPDQSKHLETAKLLVLGVWVDLTNLRTETYQSDSRIPTIRFGTAKEDAERRDFTINSLFYNINTSTVEDHTGRGLQDLLVARCIRTPLEARATFMDDPLRLLRAVRFTNRFDFAMDDAIKASASDSELQQALQDKVSRERVGMEVEGMLSGKDARPALAAEMLCSLGLAPLVFLVPSEATPVEVDPSSSGIPSTEHHTWATQAIPYVRAMNLLAIHRETGSLPPASVTSDGLVALPSYRKPRPAMRLHFLSSFLLPLADHFYTDKKGKRVDLPEAIVRNSIKFKNKDASDVQMILNLRRRFTDLATASHELLDRLAVGLLVKEAQDLWRTCLDVSCAWGLACCPQDPEGVLERHGSLSRQIEDMGLDGVWTLKPLMDGKSLITATGIKKGPLVGKLMAEQTRWQIGHPQGTLEECLEHLKAYAAQEKNR